MTPDIRFPPTPGIRQALDILGRALDHDSEARTRRIRRANRRNAEVELGRLMATLLDSGRIEMPTDASDAAAVSTALAKLRIAGTTPQ